MNLGKTLYARSRTQWRSWLARHHARAEEIWLVYPKAHSGKPRIPYNDAVEEALCYGWIDSTVKTVDADHYAQRFTPRKAGSKWSEMNKERLRRLIRQGRVTRHGLAKAPAEFREAGSERKPRGAGRLVLAPDVRRALQRDRTTWENFGKFPESYRRIRIGWIEGARRRPQIFQRRLGYFLKMTAQNKMFGMVR
jgi:uncharacterized protein YdeI (YjbR/CyaY-like superfamily)